MIVSFFTFSVLSSSPHIEEDQYCPLGKDLCVNMTQEEIDAIDLIELAYYISTKGLDEEAKKDKEAEEAAAAAGGFGKFGH